MSPIVIDSQIWHVLIDLHPRNITMLGSNTSLDVNTSQRQFLKSITSSFVEAKRWYRYIITNSLISIHSTACSLSQSLTHSHGSPIHWYEWWYPYIVTNSHHQDRAFHGAPSSWQAVSDQQPELWDVAVKPWNRPDLAIHWIYWPT